MPMSVGGVDADLDKALYGPVGFQRGVDENGEPDYLVFMARPVLNLNEFRDKCPEPPIPVSGFKPDGTKIPNPKDRQYMQDRAKWRRQRWGYQVLKSLEPSGIVFTKLVDCEKCGGSGEIKKRPCEHCEGKGKVEVPWVTLEDPETWVDVEEALKANLSHYEYICVWGLVQEANAMDGWKLEQNAKTFFAKRDRLAADPDSQNGGQESTSGGVPVSEPE